MNRKTTTVSIGGGQCRVTVVITSDPCEIGTMEARRAQVGLLRALTDNIELLNCGFKPFQKFTMRHTGEVWLVEMEAVQSE
jgi:hypothetical protein